MNTRISKQLQKFIHLESSGGIVLLSSLALALLIANSPLQHIYDAIIDLPIQIRVGTMDLHKPLLLWVNEGLMALFFMLLALEVKREVIDGELASASQIALPGIAAIGGIIMPVLIYFLITHSYPEAKPGWPIVTTTDVAFTIGLISMLGNRVPNSLKIFIITLSIVDDILAVSIIAVFYSGDLSWLSLSLALFGIMFAFLLNRRGVENIAAYMLTLLFIWICVLKSGVHATLAGVAIGFLIPLGKDPKSYSPLRTLETNLHPWIAYLVLPAFVFVNGGIPLTDMQFSQLLTPIPMGIAAGLFLGKALGVFGFAWLTIKLGLSKLPQSATTLQLYGVSTLTGIGFTMSLFLTALAFFQTPYETLAKQGVLLGSISSGIVGIAIILLANRKKQKG